MLFRMGSDAAVPVQRLTPAARMAFPTRPQVHLTERLGTAMKRSWRGVTIAVLPLLVLAVSTLVGIPGSGPGWITWLWCAALCAINVVFLVGGPTLWNALITAAVAIDDLELSSADTDEVAGWVRKHYVHPAKQVFWMLVGAAFAAGLLWLIYLGSESMFTLGPGEYVAMMLTAALAVNGLWILWWIADLIPTLGRLRSLRLDWHNPARTPAIVFLNRALWKAGGAISVGMLLLAIAVQGQPSPFSWADAPDAWFVAIVVEFVAFLIVGAVFVRDGIWAQWQVFRLVRLHIDRARRPVDETLLSLAAVYPKPGRRDDTVLYYAQLDRHFDSLHTVDLKLGWALAWATSIFGAAVSVLASTISITPS